MTKYVRREPEYTAIKWVEGDPLPSGFIMKEGQPYKKTDWETHWVESGDVIVYNEDNDVQEIIREKTFNRKYKVVG